MTNETKNVPELRFPEFDGEWEEKQLSTILEIGTGKSKVQSNENGKYNILGSTGIIGKSHTYDYEGDFILTARVGHYAGKLYKHSGKVNISDNTIYLFNFINKNFIYESLNVVKLEKLVFGSGQPLIKASDLKKLKILVPVSKEQQKIGEFFSKLDRQIELEEQKLAKLEEQKQGYMQKIFSQELRFKDENGNEYPEWESKKIEELFNLIDGDRGKNYPSDKDFYDKGHTLFLDTGNVTKNGFLFNRNRFINKEKDDILRNGKLELNDFVITSRGTLGNIGFYGQNIHHKYPNIRINSAMLILRPLNNKFNYQYLYFLLKDDAIDTFMKHYRVGSAQPHITKKDFGNMKISVITDVNEQRKIAKSLTTLDKLVINQSNKVESLKQRKQGLLQKMFI
ncbi:restriction endonuclease subunit S [Staphylococcus sp. GDY8P145P]|uniref:restriction endonuclease subunit S n=1 Tax=Mammaliicoccus sciuri TaxID=1296 RepID=UPI00194EA083